MKNKLIVTALILVATMCVSLMSGCWVDSARIKFTEEPAKTYYVGDSIGDFVLYDMDEKKEYRYSEYQSQITISGFNTEVPGTFVATITMGDYSLEWSYEVIASDAEFAGGSGTVTDPYLVANYVQFNNMLAKVNTAKVYYKLANDIDFAGHAVECKSNWYANDGKTYFNGVVNGNGYKVMNIRDIEDGLGKAVKFNEVFGTVGADFALENIEFNFAAEGAKACTGLTSSITPIASNTTIKFNNVKVTGYIDLAERNNTSVAVFMAQADRSSEPAVVGTAYSITNCVNEVNIYNGSTTMYVAGYMNTQRSTKVTFTGNSYKGTIEGGYKYTAAFIGLDKDALAAGSVINNNTIDQANSKIVKVNSNNTSGAFATLSTKSADHANSIAYYNAQFGETSCLVELAYGEIVKGAAATHTISNIASEVVTIKITYMTSYIGKDIYPAAMMNSGILNMVEKYDITAGTTSMTFVAPSVILQNGQPEGAIALVTPGMYSVTENGVKTFYTNRPDPASTVKALEVIAVGYNAEGEAIWTSGNLVAINTFANGL